MTPERLIIESMFMIADKDGNDVPFKLNREQALLDTYLSGRDRVPKARQMGITSYVLGNFTAKCLHKRNTRAVVISHDKESTQRMLSRVHYYLDNIKGPKAKTKLANKNEVTFPKTNSMFYIGTAGARKFGRGDTITDLHCSEVAYWPDPKGLTSGLYQAVPRNGTIIEESTGNGVGNYFHRGCVNAYEGKGRWKLHFLNWLQVPEYRLDLTVEETEEFKTSLKPEWEEPELLELGLTINQLAWRREKLEELDYDLRLFKQEYPITLDECFQSTGYSLFPRVNYKPTDKWIQHDAHLWVLDDEIKHAKNDIYYMGVDVGGGVNRDRSVIQISSLTRNEQVGEWVADNIAPDDLAEKIAWLGHLFNDAFVTVESNNHGGITLLRLRDGGKDGAGKYPSHLLYSQKEDTDKLLQYGFRTTAKTKPILINNLRSSFSDGYVIHSPALKDELGTFVEKENGKLEAEEGCFDDRVMAVAVGDIGAQKAFLKLKLEARARMTLDRSYDPFSLDAIIAELKGRNRYGDAEFPIPLQHIRSN